MMLADLLQLQLLHDRSIDSVSDLTQEVIALEVILMRLVSNDDRENVGLMCRYLCLWDGDRVMTLLLTCFVLLRD